MRNVVQGSRWKAAGILACALLAPGGLTTIENATIKPLTALRDSGHVRLTDFTALVATWIGEYGGRACTHRVQ